MDDIRAALDPYVFQVRREADLQAQVASLLAAVPSMAIDTEVRSGAGRYDLLVRHTIAAVFYQTTIVLELKLHSTAAAVERQTQRYALMPDVDAVGVVTTSRRLAASLLQGGPRSTLGGKPFFVIAVRTT